MAVRVVTDSTACLPTALTTRARLHVVPLTVTLSGRAGREGLDVSPADVELALAERRVAVSTSRPAPAEFLEVYRALLGEGASGVVSVHLSARLSGTYESALVAAAEFDDRVAVVDSQSAGAAVGFAALAAADEAASGAELAPVAAAAAQAARRTSTLFYVDTLEFLRRGGRISAASALLGTALAVKPILHVSNGEVVLKERVRTAGRGLARLAELAAEAAESMNGPPDAIVDIAIQHLGAVERAQALRDSLVGRLGERVGQVFVLELGAVLAAHTGPGVVGVAIYRHPAAPESANLEPTH